MIAIALGCTMMAGSIVANLYIRRVHERDLQGIGRMREDLEAARAAYARASSADDSVRLAEQIRGREEGISRREYHVPHRQAQLDEWWRITGPGMLVVTSGAVLVVGGLAVLRRRRARREGTP